MGDYLREFIVSGKPLSGVFIADCHCHLGYYKNFHVPKNTVEDMIRRMDALGINKVCISPHLASVGPDFVLGNSLALETVQRYPDRFWGYVTINPNYEIESERELDRCFTVDGMVGIKLHPSYHGMLPDNKSYKAVYQFASRYSLPVLIHVWGKGDVASFERVAVEYPEAVLIMGHAGGELTAMQDACKVAVKYPNVYLDTALSVSFQGNIEWLAGMVGAKKILYGSDMPFYDPSHVVGRIAASELTLDDKTDILGGNFKQILEQTKPICR